MKKLLFFLLFAAGIFSLQAQGLKGLLKKVTGDSSIGNVLPVRSAAGLSSDEIINGLKEALTVGATNGTQKLASVDGFFKDAAIKILMPDEAKKVEQKLRSTPIRCTARSKACSNLPE